MLSIAALIMIVVIIFLLLKNKAVPGAILIFVPVVTALLLGFSVKDVGTFVMKGLGTVSPVVAMFIFAILYFGTVSDAGMFDVFVKQVVKRTGNNVFSVAIATAIIGMIAHIEGVGAATFLITIPAMLPIYKRLNIRPHALVLLIGAAAGVMNIVPWGGPTLRAATALQMDVVALWKPLIPLQIVGLLCVIGLAYIISKIEIRNGAGQVNIATESGAFVEELKPLHRPKLLWFNVCLTIAALVLLVSSLVNPAVVFMLAMCIALPINYPDIKTQSEIIKNHAPSAMLMAVTLMGAGAFLGILSGTKMVDVLAASIIKVIPDLLAPYLHIIIGAFGAVIGMGLGPDPYYFGLLPIVKSIVANYGVDPATAARAMLIGENVAFPVSPVVPSVYLGIGLAGIQLGDHIRYSFLWLWAISLIMLFVGVITGIIPL